MSEGTSVQPGPEGISLDEHFRAPTTTGQDTADALLLNLPAIQRIFDKYIEDKWAPTDKPEYAKDEAILETTTWRYLELTDELEKDNGLKDPSISAATKSGGQTDATAGSDTRHSLLEKVREPKYLQDIKEKVRRFLAPGGFDQTTAQTALTALSELMQVVWALSDRLEGTQKESHVHSSQTVGLSKPRSPHCRCGG
jgi:hypothetical protein